MIAADRTFGQWSINELVWIPSRGMGFYPVTESPYDAAYFEKYQRYAETELGRQLTAQRVALVQRFHPYGNLVDVGIGCGAFVQARVDHGFATQGYDVSPCAIAWLERNGYWRDPYKYEIGAVSLWDSLEHLLDPARLLANVRSWVFTSLPIVPGDGPPPRDWKHFRRDEHRWYWTRAGLIGWMLEQGFRCVEHGTPESLLGRQDIETFVFRRLPSTAGGK